MIHEIDEALRALLKRDALKGTEVEVLFDAPTKEWSSRRNSPSADVYLYDIREDLRRRAVGRVDVRDNDRVTKREQPPRWFKLSYLVTAWTQRPEDEHRLLAAMLRCFLSFDSIPRDLLTGSLANCPDAIPVTCALPPPEDRALSDVWSALGGELKPSLDVVVLVPFDLTAEIEVGPPVIEEPRLIVASRDSRRLSGGGGAHADARATVISGSKRHRPGDPGSNGADPNADRRPPLAASERDAGGTTKPGRRIRIQELPR